MTAAGSAAWPWAGGMGAGGALCDLSEAGGGGASTSTAVYCAKGAEPPLGGLVGRGGHASRFLAPCAVAMSRCINPNRRMRSCMWRSSCEPMVYLSLVCVDARSCIVLYFSAHIWEAYRRYMRTAPHTKHHVARLGMLSEAHTCTSLSCSRTHRDRPSRGETATAASSTSPSLLPCAAPRACHRLPSPHRARRPHLKSRGKRPNSSASS